MEKSNVILICIDVGRLDRAKKSHVFKSLTSKGIFFPQTITYAPYGCRISGYLETDDTFEYGPQNDNHDHYEQYHDHHDVSELSHNGS